ncbi:type II toxin-antitoxin system RelE/ParE family toxin [Clostridiales bacterium COT073_COT-073]|nr:type II toxin-antitoxin system RelE/ParE family toxin [Clostridiales bacterium COT073_COT-073]
MEVKYSKQAVKFLDKQKEEAKNRIKKAIMKLPLGDVKKLKGSDYYRLRVGDFRVIFDRNFNIIHIIKIDNRGQVYKD